MHAANQVVTWRRDQQAESVTRCL